MSAVHLWHKIDPVAPGPEHSTPSGQSEHSELSSVGAALLGQRRSALTATVLSSGMLWFLNMRKPRVGSPAGAAALCTCTNWARFRGVGGVCYGWQQCKACVVSR